VTAANAMKSTSLYTLLLVGAQLISCDLGMHVDDEIAPIYGSWQWVKTQGGWSNEVQPPESVCFTEKLVLNPNGTGIYFRNDSIYKHVTFEVYKL
jgi:hypothetical protein